LVTGVSGFIGSNFSRVFKKRFPKITLVGIDEKKSSGPEDFFYKVSICDEKELEKIFKKHRPKFVFHFAALPRVSLSVAKPAITSKVNFFGTALLLEKSRDHTVRRFIFSSSSSVYGGAGKLPTRERENIPDPKSPYATQKYSCEILCKNISSLSRLDTVSLRYFNVYGSEQYGNAPYSTVISAWLESIYFPKKGRKPFLDGDGKQSRDFTYVDDIVDANINAMKAQKNFRGECFNIGKGERTNLLEIKNLIEKLSKIDFNLEKRPERPGDIRHTLADIGKAKKVLGYKPKIGIKEGLRRTIEWQKTRKK
jgi:nucleoside-diphosphate-sugar epimerase